MKIELDQVYKRYGKTEIAIKNTNLLLDGPSITGLVGRNGAGKTTLLHMVAGFLKPSKGTLMVNGEVPFNNLSVATNVSLIDDGMTFPEGLDLATILTFGASMYPNWKQEIAEGLFAFFEFDPKAKHDSLSKGKKSLFNAIFGLAARTPITLFDEPTTGMDEETRRDFYRALLKDYLDEPRIILVSSHHIEELEDLLEAVILIEKGSVFLHETIPDLEEYSFSVTGPAAEVDEVTADTTVLSEESVGPNLKRAVLKRDMKTIPEPYADRGLKVGRVSATEVCRALTKSRKGVVDDVYGKHK